MLKHSFGHIKQFRFKIKFHEDFKNRAYYNEQEMNMKIKLDTEKNKLNTINIEISK